MKNYGEARRYFQKAIQARENVTQASFGKILCNIAVGRYDEIEDDLQKMNEALCDCETHTASPPETAEEHFLAYQCRQRVREIAKQMRAQVERMVREMVPGIFQKIKILRQLYPYIDAMERNGINCCQSGQIWKCCIESLVQQMLLWNSEGLFLEKDK